MAEGATSAKAAEEALHVGANNIRKDLSGALDRVGSGDFSSLLPLFERYVLPVVTAVLILIVGYMVAKFLARIASKPVRSRVDETVGRFVAKLVFYSVFAFTVLGVLGQFGISVASFAAVVAAAGFAVGLAFQGTLSNFASGVLLLVFRPFKVGDVVTAAGITGKINEIDLFTTTFDTFDNRRIIVPNSSIGSSTIENVTFHPHRRVSVPVGVDYSADIRKTRESLEKAVSQLSSDLIEGEGRGAQVVLLGLGDSAVNWEVRFWCNTTDFFAVQEKLIEKMKDALDDASIGIPFPQMDVHLSIPEGKSELKLTGS